MRRPRGLPIQVMDLASEMFAGSTGFSGPQIHRFFARYADDIPDYAWEGGSPSRRELFRTFLSKFPIDVQRQILIDACHYEEPMRYGRPPRPERERLLAMLGGTHTPALRDVRSAAERLDWQWVVREWERARDQVHRDPAGTITAARSMLESVCKHVLRTLEQVAVPEDELSKLYRQALRALREDLSSGSNEALRQIMGGCMGIVQGLAALRNDMGDAHGRGPGDPSPPARLALLAVNAAGTAALYLIQALETQHQTGGIEGNVR